MPALEPCVFQSGDQTLLLRTATEAFEIQQLRGALSDQHYLGAGKAAGHVLWQGVYRQDSENPAPRLLAVLCWAGAAKRLKARDTWIGWDSVTCANRLKLVVQLRRFLVLEELREPNLASQCLGLSLRSLQDEWEKQYQYRPLLAESFHDPKHHTGTLYKATNWTALGLTKGYKRHRADFYQDVQSPKHLWIRPLQRSAPALLAHPGALAEVHQKAIAESTAGARCALRCKELRSLRGAFENVEDPRHPKTRRHPFTAMLTLIAYGLLCGAPDVKTIWRKCGPLDQNQRRAIGLTKRDKKSGRLTLPGYDAINDLVNAIDPASLAMALNAWLREHADLLPKSLSLDGKDLGSKGQLGAIVTLCLQSTGQPVAMASYSGKKDDCELPVSQQLLAKESPELSNRVVTADALHTQKKRRTSSSVAAGTTS
jgi:hypothetical protein|tara:strand:+ start:255 stop:1535 length:1281 start_codon:yes stop_codon:yes gene_type:complete